jgi:transcriptional regulator with XRE-family HTH domain
MSTFENMWEKLAANKKYREEFVAAVVKRAIPIQARTLRKKLELSQDQLATQSGLTQGVVSRAEDPNYGNLTLNTIVRYAAGLDMAFIGKFVPFSEFVQWADSIPNGQAAIPSFDKENEKGIDRILKDLSSANQADSSGSDDTSKDSIDPRSELLANRPKEKIVIWSTYLSGKAPSSDTKKDSNPTDQVLSGGSRP